MNLYYKKIVIDELTFEDGDFSTSFGNMERHIETHWGYFNNLPYPKERDSRIDEYLIKKGIAIRNKDGDLEVTEKTSEFIERFNELLNNI
tara:strand:+ start:1524 stop:1793 length:270 start_codon:yes stop_codon:yes gene_type:complete